MNKCFLFLTSVSSLILAQGSFVEQSIAQNCKRIESWQEKGVRFVRPECVLIDDAVHIGKDTVIDCGVHLINGAQVGSNCEIKAFCIIDGCTIGDNVVIDSFASLKNSHIEDNAHVYSHTVLEDATIEGRAKVGPFARIRKGSTIKSEAEVGNFVEMSDSTIGNKSKAKHLTYLGCTLVEEKVNIGAGTITCNYDGFSRNRTLFKHNSFIGSNSTFVAPVIVGEGAITAAGSTFTQEIPDNALAIGRAHQENKLDYAPSLRDKFKRRAQSK